MPTMYIKHIRQFCLQRFKTLHTQFNINGTATVKISTAEQFVPVF